LRENSYGKTVLETVESVRDRKKWSE